ncbi:PREDICTED: RNA pseudouridylate synthase domain-containing protein 3 isoform X4 [Chinchilla lanigera]|uniref:RNA pseudouridylate synthase domain-containing protein 3 isoform X4 n=1 Tax=Chinchilla lanigera TaxID=34839 RepID=UPI000698D891|nr:PREDICTED: RNA pseudouridylate synthase domain-containing protein 3 isoform X4 [Chinchilla lanigera]
MGAGLDAHAHSASREMGALVAWGRGVGGWRLALGARLPPWDAGFCTEPGLQSWRGGDREALLLELRAAVVEHRGPLVTLNKPQGLPVTGKPGELTLLSVLPDLSQSLGCPSLQVIRAPGKETSGLVLLSTCPQTASRLQKFFIRSRRAHRPTATYWAVTNGIPDASEGQILAALTLQHIGGVSVVSWGQQGRGRSLHVCHPTWAGDSGEVPISKGPLGGCQEDPQPLPCNGHRLWLCPDPAAAPHIVPQSAAGTHDAAALPCAWGPHLFCSSGHCPGPALSVVC